MGLPFTEEEEKKGVAEDIINFRRSDKLSCLEVNKTGTSSSFEGFPNQFFYKRGNVGDWAEYLACGMLERLNCITKEKRKDWGLDFILHL